MGLEWPKIRERSGEHAGQQKKKTADAADKLLY